MQFHPVPAAVLITGALFACLPAGPLAAQTTPVAVTNASFELPTQTDGTAILGLTGWTVVGNVLGVTETVQTLNPNNTQYSGTSGANSIAGMDGSQIASFRSGPLSLGSLVTLGGSATQSTGQLLALNTLYTLTVGVGNSLDTIFQGYTVSLLTGGSTVLASANATTGGVPTNGTFQDVSINYILTDPLSGLLNSPIFVSISAPGGVLGGIGQTYGTDFDNVRVTATPTAIVPEPSTYACVGLGLLGLIGVHYARRRRGIAVLPA